MLIMKMGHLKQWHGNSTTQWSGDLRDENRWVHTEQMVCFTTEVNTSLAKLPLKFNGSLAKLGLTSLATQAADIQ